MLCQCIKSGNELFYHTNMFCRDTGSSTCSSQWQGFERIQPPSFWRRWSAAGLRGTPPHTRLSGNIEWQILLSLYLLYVAPTKKFFHQDTDGNKLIQWLYFRIGPVCNYFEYLMGYYTTFSNSSIVCTCRCGLLIMLWCSASTARTSPR